MKHYKAIYFDWDGTAVKGRLEDTSSIISAMKNLLQKGIRLIIVSGTTYDNICGGKLAELLPLDALQYLYLGLARGNYCYGFDSEGKVVLLQDRTPSLPETLSLHKAVFQIHTTLLSKYNLQSDIVFSRPNYCKMDLMVSSARNGQSLYMQADEVSKINELLESHEIKGGLPQLLLLAEQIGKEEGLLLKATTDAKYLEVGYTTKSDNILWFSEFLKKDTIFPSDSCFFGDEFAAIAPGIWGSDSQMIIPQTKNCDFYSVSDIDLPLPTQVTKLGGGIATFINFLRSYDEDLSC